EGCKKRAAQVGPPFLRSEHLKQYDAGQNHDDSGDPSRSDRVLMDAEEPEVIDEQSHKHLYEDDGHQRQPGTEGWHADEGGRDVERAKCPADEMPRSDAANCVVVCDEADVPGDDQ